jgi:hypothetical protein
MESYYFKILKEMKYTVKLFLTIAIGCIVMLTSCEKNKDDSLSIDKTEIEVSASGGVTLINVSASQTWNASADAEWVSLLPASGNGSGALTVMIDSCVGSRRTAEIIVVSGSNTQKVAVLQRGNQKDDYWKQGEIIYLHRHSIGTGVVVVILGDGFDREDCRRGGVYEYNCRKMADLFLSMPVIRDFKGYFDVLARVDVSRERGVRNCVAEVADGHPEKCPDNAYGSGHPDLNWDKIFENARLTSEIAVGKEDHSTILMANGMIGGHVILDIAIYSADEPNKPYWMMHEFCGHVLGGFPDLYYITGSDSILESTKTYFDGAHRDGEMLMLDYQQDPEKVYWKDFINQSGYTNVDVYPAALWRLKLGQLTSCENIFTSVMYGPTAHYTVMERYMLWRKILIRSGETINIPITIENFKEYDKDNKLDSDWTWDKYDNWTDDRIN